MLDDGTALFTCCGFIHGIKYGMLEGPIMGVCLWYYGGLVIGSGEVVILGSIYGEVIGSTIVSVDGNYMDLLVCFLFF